MALTPNLQTVTTFTVDGVDFLPYLLVGCTREANGNARQVAKFPIKDETGTLTVPDLAEVVFSIDGVVEFSGVVWDVQLERLADVHGARLYTLQCVDWSFALDTTLINGIYPAGTLLSLLTTIIANASFFGITLDSAQDTGPNLPDQAWEFLTLRQAIDRVIGTWIWAINPDTKEFRAYEPYTVVAPRNFDETALIGSGLFEVRSVKNFNRYTNDGYIRYGPAGPAYVTDRITGNGTDSTFTLPHSYLQMNATGTLTHTISGTPATQTVSEDGTALFTVNRSNNTLTYNSGPIALNDTVDFEYLAQYPQYYHFIDSAAVLANGTFSRVIVDENILLESDAILLAEKILDRDGGPYREVTFKTHFGYGLQPLQAVTLNVPSLNIAASDEFLISSVTMREIAIRDLYGDNEIIGSYFEWFVTCQEGLTIYDWLDEFRDDPLPTASSGAAGPPTTEPITLYPVVQSRTKSHNTSDTTSHSISLPGSIQVGELLLVVFAVDAAPTITIDTGVSGSNWNLITPVSQSTNVTGAILWKIAEGSDVLTLTTSSAQQSSWISMRISGTATSSPVSVASVTSNSTNINPPGLTPPAGQLSYLWLATFHGDAGTNHPSVAMASYSNFFKEVGGVSGATVATAERLLNASTEDPNNWVNGLVFSVAFTVSIRPA